MWLRQTPASSDSASQSASCSSAALTVCTTAYALAGVCLWTSSSACGGRPRKRRVAPIVIGLQGVGDRRLSMIKTLLLVELCAQGGLHITMSMRASVRCFQATPQQISASKLLDRAAWHRLEPLRWSHSEAALRTCRHACRRRALPVTADASDHENAASPPVAGIPVSVDRSTAVGERLWTALQQHPHDFVSIVVIELQQARTLQLCCAAAWHACQQTDHSSTEGSRESSAGTLSARMVLA